jgi:long-chain acyl-CoA synthetase
MRDGQALSLLRRVRLAICCKIPRLRPPAMVRPAHDRGDSVTEQPDTFPRLLLHQAKVRPGRPAFREKDLGIWQTWSWAQVADEVRSLACGLAAQGFRRGDRLAVIGDNRPRLYWAMMAAQALGGVPVPLYQDAVAAEMVFVLQDADIGFAVVEDQEQVDKLLEVLPQCPRLKRICFDDPRGLRHYAHPALMSLDGLQESGREVAQREFFAGEIEKGRPSDIAVILYTSGTTGSPKGVSQTHAAMVQTARVLVAFDGFGEDDDILCYLPMAWVGDFLYSYAQVHVAGFCLNCPESPATVMTDLREIGPTYYFGPPRVYENILTQVMIRIEDASWIKRRMFHAFMGVAKRVGMKVLERRSGVSLKDRLLYGLGELLVYGPLKNVLGMSRIRVAYTGGEAIGPDLFDFYRSIGINLKQLYGMTETCVTVSMHPSGDVKLETVGRPMPGVEVRIADSGEVLVRSPGVMKEYYKQPDATREAIDAEGFFHTGDAGYLDADGHLKIIDRAKDVGKLGDGTLFAPKYIENKLKFFPYIKEAVCFGHGRDKVCAFVNFDMEAVANWAEKRNLPYTGYTDLAAQPAVHGLVRECVEKVNRDLAADAALGSSQIHRFLILQKELDADDGELTRTRKVRRRHIGEKYAVLVDALYSDKTSCFIETQMRFEDGRSGTVSADLKIIEARTYGVAAAARQAA